VVAYCGQGYVGGEVDEELIPIHWSFGGQGEVGLATSAVATRFWRGLFVAGRIGAWDSGGRGEEPFGSSGCRFGHFFL